MKAFATALGGFLAVTLLFAARPVRSDTSFTPGPRAGASREVCELGRVDRSAVRSASCLGCHDGTTGSAVAWTTTAGVGGMDVHPVEVDYGLAFARSPETLRNPAELPREIVLSNGRVTCATCHDGASPLPFKTAVTMSGSRLCQACHAM